MKLGFTLIAALLLTNASFAVAGKKATEFKRAVASSEKQVEITGDSAKKLYFALEQNGATMDIHTRRITQYTKGNISCYVESAPGEGGSSTDRGDFGCVITL